MNPPLQVQALVSPAPARVLACGAFLKNRACLLAGDQATWSAQHGDLSTPAACAALEDSLGRLVQQAGGRVDAVAHDLHPDFHSTRAAQAWARRLGVPCIGVQHHHAHIGVLQAEWGRGDEPLLGLALDGVGLGTDGTVWGGELLLLEGEQARRLGHLAPLALPGGDVAAREPWRLAAAVLHAAGRAGEIESRFAPVVGAPLARGVRQMLDRDLNCPRSSSAGRWFDAAAGMLGLSVRQSTEAEAALALERAATGWLASNAGADLALPAPSLDLLPLVASLADEADAGRGAARFHRALAPALVHAAVQLGGACDARAVALGGGCFFNRLLLPDVEQGLRAQGLRVLPLPQAGCGDAGLALGQAWVAALQLARAHQRVDTLTEA